MVKRTITEAAMAAERPPLRAERPPATFGGAHIPQHGGGTPSDNNTAVAPVSISSSTSARRNACKYVYTLVQF